MSGPADASLPADLAAAYEDLSQRLVDGIEQRAQIGSYPDAPEIGKAIQVFFHALARVPGANAEIRRRAVWVERESEGRRHEWQQAVERLANPDLSQYFANRRGSQKLMAPT